MGLLSKALGRADTKDHSSTCIISPTRHLLDNRKQMIHAILGPCYIPPLMMTLRQFSIHVSTTYGRTTGFPDEFIAPFISAMAGSGIGYATLAAEFIREIKHQYPGVPHGEIVSVLSEAFEKENIPDEVAKRANECLDLMERYEGSLEKAGLSDSADVIADAADLLDELDMSTLILDGFYELTPLELRLVQAMVNRVDNCLVLIPISHPGDDLSYCFSGDLAKSFEVTPELSELSDIKDNSENPPAFTHFPAKGLEDEVESIARHIKANHLNSRNRELEDTWIVFPKLAPYRSMVERVLTRYGIPHCFSSGQSLAEKPAYRDLICMLEAVAGDYPRVAFSRMLHSPYFRNIPPELRAQVPSVSLATGLIRGAHAWRRAFKAKGLLKEINTVLKALEPLSSISISSSYSTFVNVLLDVLARLGFEPSDEGIAETEDALGTLSMLDQIITDDTGDDVDTAKFIEAVKRALGAKSSASDNPGVRVAELFEVRGLEPRMLYLAGIKDGDLPAKPDMDFILPERVRSRLGLVDTNRFMHLQGHIFRRLSTSAYGLFMSYPQMEGDKLFLPSLFLSGTEAVDASIKGIYSEEERQTSGRHSLLAHPEVKGVSFNKKGGTLRVTAIDSYRSCPRRYFLENVLGTMPPDLLDYEIEARELGTIIHEVMEDLITIPLPSPDVFRTKAEKVLDQVLKGSGLDAYLASLMKESFLLLLDDIYALEQSLEEEGYTKHEAEMPVMEDLEGVALKGKIDRVITREGGSSLIDYKTGAVNLSGVGALRGEDLQLFLYASILEAKGMEPERVGIYSLKDMRIKWVPNSRDIKNGNDLSVLMGAAGKYLKEAASAMDDGDYPAQPLKDQRCRNCHERPYCPYIHGLGQNEQMEG